MRLHARLMAAFVLLLCAAAPAMAQRTTTGTMMGRICIARHGRAINVAFADGHAAAVPLRQLWTLYWRPSAAMMAYIFGSRAFRRRSMERI